jgi:hypothetical protein
MAKPLRDQINDVVVFYLEDKVRTNAPANTAAMAREMAECIVDMIMEQDEQQQASLIAQAITALGDEYLRRCGLIQTERRDN